MDLVTEEQSRQIATTDGPKINKRPNSRMDGSGAEYLAIYSFCQANAAQSGLEPKPSPYQIDAGVAVGVHRAFTSHFFEEFREPGRRM